MFDLPKYGDGVCLARLAELLDAIAVDRARLQRVSVVVTGSNGKGSTAAFCAGIARAYGLRTGLFTSPHLFRVNERFQIDGTPVGDDDLARLGDRLRVIARLQVETFEVVVVRDELLDDFYLNRFHLVVQAIFQYLLGEV